jgi:hypothetical protein
MRPRASLLALLLVGCTTGASAAAASDHGNIRLAQTSAVTTCLMTCNSQAAACATTCIMPGAAPTGAATTGGNANLNTTCQVNCSTQQISCQTTCAQTSPSQ